MSEQQVKVPDIGDFSEVAVIEVLVKPGDTVAVEQSLITVESDKASMEIPSSAAGVVKEVKVNVGDKVKEVRVTFRLTDSPSCLVADDNDMSGYLQRMLKAAGQNAPAMQPILEINPEHALVKQLNADSANFGDWCHLLFDQALLAEGGMLDDPASFVKRTNALLLSRTA